MNYEDVQKVCKRSQKQDRSAERQFPEVLSFGL